MLTLKGMPEDLRFSVLRRAIEVDNVLHGFSVALGLLV